MSGSIKVRNELDKSSDFMILRQFVVFATCFIAPDRVADLTCTVDKLTLMKGWVLLKNNYVSLKGLNLKRDGIFLCK